jgi:hypothetical protein
MTATNEWASNDDGRVRTSLADFITAIADTIGCLQGVPLDDRSRLELRRLATKVGHVLASGK